MTRRYTDAAHRLLGRTMQVLGKWWVGVISLPARPPRRPAHRDRYERDESYPRFPSF